MFTRSDPSLSKFLCCIKSLHAVVSDRGPPGANRPAAAAQRKPPGPPWPGEPSSPVATYLLVKYSIEYRV